MRTIMGKRAVPPQLRDHQFGKGSPKAKTAGAKGGRKSPAPAKAATAPASAGAKGKAPNTRMKPGGGSGKRSKSKG